MSAINQERKTIQSYPSLSQQRLRRAENSKGIRWVWWTMVFLACLALLPLWIVAGEAFYYKTSERILPGVYSGAVDLSNLTIAEAAEQIDLFWNQTPHFLVRAGEKSWPVSPASLGLWIDPGITAQQAFGIGRDQGGISESVRLLRIGSLELDPFVRFDPKLAADGLQALADQVYQPAQDAQLVQNEASRWIELPARIGYRLDVQQAVTAISADPAGVLKSGSLSLEMISVSADTTNLTPLLEKIDSYYHIPLKMAAYDAITDELLEWDLPQDLVAGWVRLDDPQGIPYLQVNQQQMEDYLSSWQAGIGNREIQSSDSLESVSEKWETGQPFMISLRHLPTTYTVQTGDNLVSIGFKVGMPYWRIQEANPGVSILNIGAGQVLTIPSKNDLLPLPVVPGKRIKISISQQHMWVYQNGQLRSEHIISTGIDRSPTMAGVFQIQTHELNAYASNWDLWMPHFLGIYEAVPGFMNRIHGLPLLSSGVRLWGNVLGSKASYGCIIMDLAAAEDLYNWAENGVVVEITP